jgi:vacuolar protein sorting-associated protein 13A/C
MQALKDVALRLLNVYVSPYVENLNAHDLSVSVFGGKPATMKSRCHTDRTR